MSAQPATHPITGILDKLDGVKPSGPKSWSARCPAHDDQKRSLSVTEAPDKALVHCHRGCTPESIVAALGLTLADLFTPKKPAAKSPKRKIAETYPYHAEDGALLFQVVRFDPKDFSQRHPNPQKPGEWIWNLQGVRRVLYRLPELLAADPSTPVLIVEGEKDVEALRALGFVATCNPHGAEKWREDYSDALRGRQAVIIPDNDDAGAKHAQQVAKSLAGKAAVVKVIELPRLGPRRPKHGPDVSDWLRDAGGTADELRDLIAKTPPIAATQPRTLNDVLTTFRKWLHMPDAAPVEVLLGTVAANLLPGDPVWLLYVGPPGGGKTELLQSIARLPDVHLAATITEPALLSGTPKRDKDAAAKGGLLRNIGDFGFILCKDFTSILSMHREARGSVLAALREVYDGSWTRHVGVDGGKTLHWAGKVAMIAGCTPTIDSHHAVMASMGERFIVYRMPPVDDAHQAGRALAHIGHEVEMRAELAEAVAGLFAGLDLTQPTEPLSDDDRTRLIELATLAARCRSAVERDSHTREIILIPAPEAPSRLTIILSRLLTGMRAIGVDQAEAWRVLVDVGFHSMPALRRAIFEVLSDADEVHTLTTSDIAEVVQYPTATTRRALEDLTAHGVVIRQAGGDGKADRWHLSGWSTARLKAILTVPETNGTLPEKSDRVLLQPSDSSTSFNNAQRIQDDKTGKVNNVSGKASSSDQAEESAGVPFARIEPERWEVDRGLFQSLIDEGVPRAEARGKARISDDSPADLCPCGAPLPLGHKYRCEGCIEAARQGAAL